MALADVDGDGTLDLYVANYRTTTIRSTGFNALMKDGKKVIRPEDKDDLEFTPEGRVVESGEPHVLYMNKGNGRFQPVSWTGGAFLDDRGERLPRMPRDWGLSVMMRDLNGDGLPDIYVCNDFQSPDRVWINIGEGRFHVMAILAMRSTCTFSMSADAADINRDGFLDLFESDMLPRGRRLQIESSPGIMAAPGDFEQLANRPQNSRNALQLNRGDGTFADIAYLQNAEASGWTWSSIFLDVDLDGYEDLLLTTGNLFNTQDLDANDRIAAHRPYRKETMSQKLLMYPPLRQARLLYHNLQGHGFEEVGQSWGFGETGIAHGMCLADLDGDGDLDVIVNNLNGPAGIYRNESGAPRLAVRLKGAGANTQGIGAKIRVYGGPVPMQSQEMIAGGRYLSGDEALRVFAAGSLTNRLRVEVDWRSGQRSVVDNLTPNQICEIAESSAAEPLKTNTAPKVTWFEEVPLGHEHHEEPFDDFQRQPLLPKKLSQLGPGVAWMDLDGDGHEDLVIGGGKGGTLAVYHNHGQGGFSGTNLVARLDRDTTGLALWRDPQGHAHLLAGTSDYEDAQPGQGGVQEFDLATGQASPLLAIKEATTGPLALGDLHGNGTLSLFVGARVVPSRYPEAASSRIYKRINNQWQVDEANTQALKNTGLVSGAVWTDLDGDGLPELVLACEWGPLKVYKNTHGQLQEATQAWGLDRYTGWWNGVTAGDFDGDGKLDLAASNWGLNTKYRASAQHPCRMYYGNLSGQGLVETVEAAFDLELNKWAPERDLNAMATSLPYLKDRYGTHREYAQAGLDEVLQGHSAEMKILEAAWLETTVFLNRGNHFEPVKLPVEAQYSPAFGISAADLDGDGHEDLFLSQNFFAVAPVNSRNDAGRSLFLKGDGRGSFEAVKGQDSGIKVYGEQRGSALCDYDGDGRVDVVVAQNGAATKLYHNRTAQPGLRVRLKGPPGNPEGIGAVIRLGYGNNEWGPAREVHAGSGYWSQDGAVQVMGLAKPPAQAQVRWPGGRTTAVQIPPGTREIVIKTVN
ncbi:MAG TPA: FG-GAP-like repeat-containing protein [Verrucomicrobiae bacterium]